MRNRVERLRIWLLGSAVFLMLVIAAFIGTARYVRHRLLANLPGKLGVNVVSDASGWTYSQSRGSQTVYVIHASKWERIGSGTAGAGGHGDLGGTEGKFVLHGVSILLYGVKGNRHDRIYGDEFEYDQGEGVVRATGLVHIDLQAAGDTSKPVQGIDSDAKVMHVTTSGLMYLQKLGVAATSDPIEFESGGIKGHAVGADYSSDSGMLILHSAVSIRGVAGGRPVNVTAATAEFDDQSQQAHLTRAKYESQGRTAAGDEATLYRRQDGTLSRIEAKGNVTGQANGANVNAQRADIALTVASQPETALLTGGVKYSADEPLRKVSGTADVAKIAFDGQTKPQPAHASFSGVVHMTERTRATVTAKEPWSTRDLTAEKVELTLVRGADGKAQLRDVAATGNPRVNLVNNGTLAKTSRQGTTELSADQLGAHLVPAADAKSQPQLDTIVGRGHTVLRQINVDGLEQTSTGDSLDAKMRPRAGGGKKSAMTVPDGIAVEDALLNAVQVGNVTVVRRSPARPGNSGSKVGQGDVEHASAQRAMYDGDMDRLTLAGSVTMTDEGSGLWADQVELDHKTGDAHATGRVKMNYVQDASDGVSQSLAPTHILADRADLEHATGIATFFGKPVRMWQGGNQVQAPVIEFEKTEKRLIARGEGSTGWSGATQPAQVFTTLLAVENSAAAKTGAETPACAAAVTKTGTAKAGAGGEARGPQLVRIASGGLIYSGILRQADFTGGFRADTVDGTIRAADGTVYMQKTAADPAGSDAAGASLNGHLDRVVATGHVELVKPGMKGTGERLVYTAADRVALLTGDPQNPPRAVGAQGTTTGGALRFNSCDGSVEAMGAPGQRVLTDAETGNEGKKDKAKR